MYDAEGFYRNPSATVIVQRSINGARRCAPVQKITRPITARTNDKYDIQGADYSPGFNGEEHEKILGPVETEYNRLRHPATLLKVDTKTSAAKNAKREQQREEGMKNCIELRNR